MTDLESLWRGSAIDSRFLPSQISRLRPLPVDWTDFESRRRAAVCVLFAPPSANGDRANLILTRRAKGLRSHSGQISLAGGRAEAIDQSPVDTALREAAEELGLRQSEVQAHAALPEQTALDGSPVVPIIATTNVIREQMQPQLDEVAHIIAAPWDCFTPAANRPFGMTFFGVRRRSNCFEIDDRHKVWGLTARLFVDAALGS